MIVRMSKVKVAGPKELLESVLHILRESGVLQIDPSASGFIEKAEEEHIKFYVPDKGVLSERLFLDELRAKLNELFSYLPEVPARYSYIEPRTIIDTLSETLQKHLETCKEKFRNKEALQKELNELTRYRVFLDALAPLIKDLKESPDLDLIGLTLKDTAASESLREALLKLTRGNFELLTSTTSEGTSIGLIAVEKRYSNTIKTALSDKNIPEFKFPPSLTGLGFLEKIDYLKTRLSEISKEIEGIKEELFKFSMRWGPIYKRVREWLDESLSIFRATASVFETKMCFFIHGWMPAEDIAKIRKRLNGEFGGRVVIEELEIMEQDLGKIPVIIKNPAYFKPFELFTRILPLPRYTSYDPTPFIAIFFPIFFGMILGDIGYGLILLMASLILIKTVRTKKIVQDASKILLIVSVYSILFGILYGEFFGELGHRLFGLKAIYFDRRTSFMPMLYFAVTVGVVHVTIGFLLGFVSAVKEKTTKRALYKLLNILIILCIIALVTSLFGFFPGVLARPLVIAILVMVPLLLFTGGLLAPLELMKSIGNIISYARIMAIGLSSVLLSFVANRLGGMTGDIVVGTLVAGLLHLLNIIIGVFSPTIHSLRLHYVEFFDKFIEHGGRKFEPFKK